MRTHTAKTWNFKNPTRQRAAAPVPQVRAILRGPRVQRKLRVGAANDPAEAEADRVADQVMRMPDPAEGVTATPPDLSSDAAPIHRLCAECEEEVQRQPVEEEELLQTKGEAGRTPAVTPGVTAGIASLRGRGQPLPASERAFFEPRFGRDFGHVRVHTDARAARLAKALNAEAFTSGSDVAFAPSKYAPGTTEGRRLLAHELSHVLQQRDVDVVFRQEPLDDTANEEDTGFLEDTGVPEDTNLPEDTGVPEDTEASDEEGPCAALERKLSKVLGIESCPDFIDAKQDTMDVLKESEVEHLEREGLRDELKPMIEEEARRTTSLPTDLREHEENLASLKTNRQDIVARKQAALDALEKAVIDLDRANEAYWSWPAPFKPVQLL